MLSRVLIPLLRGEGLVSVSLHENSKEKGVAAIARSDLQEKKKKDPVHMGHPSLPFVERKESLTQRFPGEVYGKKRKLNEFLRNDGRRKKHDSLRSRMHAGAERKGEGERNEQLVCSR